MIDEGILSKESRLIALYGQNAQASPFLKRLNTAFRTLGLPDYAVGLDIAPEHFAYMLKGMPNSKVTMALYEPEYRKEAAALVDLPDTCTTLSGLCDGAVAREGKLASVCFFPEAFERLLACESVNLRNARVLLLGMDGVNRALLPLLGVLEVASVEVACERVEEGAGLLEASMASLTGVKKDVHWLREGMAIEADAYDTVVVDTALPFGVKGGAKTLWIDVSEKGFVERPVPGRVIGAGAWQTARALSVAVRWLGAEVNCDQYDLILNKTGG
jgi:shikimate 5-dehydrogenase